MESLVKLTVKTPNQRIDDVQIDCDLKWSVKRLKEYLQDVYPSKPASSSQKLIYLGKLLQDHDLLKEVFGEWGARTLHLVCAENNSVDENNDADVSSLAPSKENATPAQEPVSETPPAATAGAVDGLRYRGNIHHSVPYLMSSMHSPLMTTGSSMPNLAHWHQFQQQHEYPWAHHYYAHMQYYQYMQQWHAAMQNGEWPLNPLFHGQSSPPLTPGTPPVITPITPQSPQQLPVVQPEPPQAQPPNGQNGQNMQMNNGVGGPAMADDEEDNGNPRNRDWLDWLYMSMRVLMLFSIIYFYSSTSRFLMVALLGFIIYIYQAGWFTPRRRVLPPPPQVRQAEHENRNDRDEENNAPVNEETNTNTEPTVVEPPQLSVFRILRTFFVSFITSLIPTAPPEAQQQ